MASTLTLGKTQKPDNIFVYGKRYQVTTTEKTSYAEETSSVSDNSIQGLMVVDHDSINARNTMLSVAFVPPKAINPTFSTVAGILTVSIGQP